MADWKERTDLTIRQPCAIYHDVRFGKGVSTGHFVLIREHVTIGDDVSIGSYTEIAPWVYIGDGVRIHSHCFVSEHTLIGSGAWLGPGVMIANVLHPLCAEAKLCIEAAGRVQIRERAIVGMGAIIGPGVIVGEDSFVGAGSLVLHDVPAGKVVYGSPARKQGDRDDLRCKSELMDQPYGGSMAARFWLMRRSRG